MKKLGFNKNYLFYGLIFLCGILSVLSYKVSYSSNDYVTSLEPNMINSMSDSDVWNFILNTEDEYTEKSEIIESYFDNFDISQVEIATLDDEEDPDKEIKRNNAKKGTAKSTTTKKDVKKYETNETSLGIDVSTWQGDIDWKKVKASGVSFAMIRVGFRRMDSGTIVMDNKFLQNIKGAIANNINVGIYFFSMAKNSSEALEEAIWVSNVIKKYDITYPVAIDTEIFDKHRLKGVSYSTLTNNALVFCEYIKKQGYTPMIYSYANAFTKYFNTAKFDKQRIWLAQFNDSVTYKGNYHMWQYTSSGNVPGIKGRVDMNVAYFSVTNDVTRQSIVNGITNTGDLDIVSFIDMNMETVLSKTVNLRASPYLNLPNKAGELDKETKVIVTGISDNFVRILYNGDIFYINDTECFVMNLEEVTFLDVDLDVKVEKKVTLLKQPYNFLKDNVFMEVDIMEELNIVGVNNNYVKIFKGNNFYYINDVDFYSILNDNNYNKSGRS